MPRFVRFLLIVLAAPVPPMRAAAQAKAETFAEQELHACNGELVSAIEVHAQPPSYNTKAAGAYETMEHVVGIHHMTTREGVVRSYLRVKVGQRCTERSRSESERLLRAQPFIALASVRAFPDGEGQVRLHVDVVDEIALIGGGSTSRGTISSLALGSQNIAGLGLGALVSFDRGFAYRNGIGVRLIRYGAFGAPDYVAVAAQREQLGEALSFEVAEPFLTDLARRAFHVGASEASSYYGVIRPAGDFVSLYTRRVSYDAGWVEFATLT